jgi:DNA-binding PadR family transcriptional regulator
VFQSSDQRGEQLGKRVRRSSGPANIKFRSAESACLNQGTLYPALLTLEQLGWISSKWGQSESGRRVKIYTLTRAGRAQLQKEEAQWQRAAGIVERAYLPFSFLVAVPVIV